MLERVVSRGHEFTIHPWPLWVSMVAIAFGAVALLLYARWLDRRGVLR